MVQAATRGDGREGEDVTHNLVTPGAVQGLPVALPSSAGSSLALPAELEVRGEIYIKDEDFQQVCLPAPCGLGVPVAAASYAQSMLAAAQDEWWNALNTQLRKLLGQESGQSCGCT